ncbi:uncharacterized protein J4E88_006912 [Alternaria novae-zelandiae]|uniref:uncharacterized protein n=1 Tax=Alternaria novae-zelandiae TaxID=430562 RepID=UPI0020C1DDFB|nr:uncharacterized protein J4E88_006912 [Alternaria novae-zelandiae]KAI4677105.1 hypothetical protein J4E88_006912 [Alternaria novae-zelandiae]
MNPFGNSGGDDFFSGMGGPFGGPMGGMGGGPFGGMGGMMGGGPPPMMGRGGGGGPMGGGNPRQGGYSFSSTFDSTRPEGQQYQEHHEPFGDYAGSRGGGGGPMSGMGGSSHESAPRGSSSRGLMFSGLSRADNPFRQSRTTNTSRAQEQPSYGQQRYMDDRDYTRGGAQDPRYGAGYEDLRAGGQYGQSGGPGRMFDYGRQQPSRQQGYYEDESDSEDEGYGPQQRYAPQQAYGGGGGSSRRAGGGGGGGGRQFFNFDLIDADILVVYQTEEIGSRLKDRQGNADEGLKKL